MTANPFVRASRLSGALEKVLRRILRSEKQARHGLETEAIHDLRVALRRCRSLAEGFAEMDARPVWRRLRKACSKQQAELSELRDSQVLAEWMEKFDLNHGPHAHVLRQALKKEERHGRRKAKASLKSFSRKQWKERMHALPGLAGELRVGASRLARIAFDRATMVCLLERRLRRRPSVAAWHRLRVAVKRLRYAVESFLPEQHAEWNLQLKRLQDALGEGHDLDVLRARVLLWARKHKLPHDEREGWLGVIATARAKMTARYLRASAATARDTDRHKNRTGGKSLKPQCICDVWRVELGRLAKVNPADVARLGMSAAIRG